MNNIGWLERLTLTTSRDAADFNAVLISGITSASCATALPMEMDYENNTIVTAADKTYAEGIPQLRRSKSVSPSFFRTRGYHSWLDAISPSMPPDQFQPSSRAIWRLPSAAIKPPQRIRSDRLVAPCGLDANLPLARVQTVGDTFAQWMSRAAFVLPMRTLREE